jgi:hypothetical protein
MTIPPLRPRYSKEIPPKVIIGGKPLSTLKIQNSEIGNEAMKDKKRDKWAEDFFSRKSR